MTQYLLSVFQPNGPIPAPEVLAGIAHDLEILNQELMDAGAWVFSGRLHEADTATVVRVSDGEVLTTDGPFAEAREHLGGFYIIEADDLDAALAWASKTTAAVSKPIEVLPFRHAPDA